MTDLTFESASNRKKVLNIISQALDNANDAGAAGELFDPAEEATRLLDQLERLCVGRLRGELIFADPYDTNAFLEGGPF